ncbi:MAG: trypsin-like peptidase domain-containing protein [Chloroflexota bacterium]
MAAVVGVIALASGGDNNGGSVQNVTSGTPKATSGSNGTASNQTTTGDCQSAADIYEEVRPSVVEIDISGSSSLGGTISGTGTGIVLDEEGHILTNNHVIDSADEISVLFDDGDTATATVAGTDTQNDLAVIKIDPAEHDLSPATLGDSSDLRVGDSVLALGNPFNLEGSLTQGIVSGLNRAYSEGASTRPIRGMIQTDAAINPGNSGGPLINCYGDVVGVNTLLENPTGDTVNVGVGFAVAVNTVKAELEDLKSSAEVQPAWLGIAGVDVASALKDQLNLTVDQGVYVTLVNAGSPAADAGLIGAFANQDEANAATEPVAGGDVIVSADGEEMTSIDQLATYLDRNKAPGATVELGVVRDGQEQTITATLAPWPSA